MNPLDLFELGIAAAERGDREQARSLLLQVVEDKPPSRRSLDLAVRPGRRTWRTASSRWRTC